MSGLSELQVYALTDALRRVAPEHLHLADSLSFGGRLEGASPSAPDWDDRVRSAVRDVSGPSAADIAAARTAEADRAARQAVADRKFKRQWDAADVQAASLPEIQGAYRSGQLAEVMAGPPPARPEKREAPRPPMPSAAQAARWKNMPPWQAQRARAAWQAEHQGPPVAPQPQPVSVPRVPDGRHLTNEQLAARCTRRAQLTADYAGLITAEEVAVVAPDVVVAWMNQGKLSGGPLDVPPQRQRGGPR